MRYLALAVLIGASYGCGDDSSSAGGTGGSAATGGSGGVGGDAPLLDEYILEDDMLVPESGTFDPTGRNFYVGSATEGNITRVAADGTETVIFEAPGETWRTLGMVADPNARRLWVCARRTTPVEENVWVFDLDTDERTLILNLDDADVGSTCNDVAVDGDGIAYISDSANPRVYAADANLEAVTTWAEDPLLDSDGGVFGGNGIAVTEDDAYVLISKTFASTMTPRLVRINRNDPAMIDGITTTPELVGTADGMSILGGELYLAIVSPGEIFRLVTDDDWATATITRTTAPAGTSTVRPAEGDLYGIYSDISSALLMQPLTPPFRIFRVELNSFE